METAACAKQPAVINILNCLDEIINMAQIIENTQREISDTLIGAETINECEGQTKGIAPGVVSHIQANIDLIGYTLRKVMIQQERTTNLLPGVPGR